MNTMNANTTTTEIKTNRYAILGAELKRLSAELKAKKKEMVEAIRKLEAEYRAYRKNVYAPARKAAWQTFNETKVRVAKPKVEKVKLEKEVKVKKVKSATKVKAAKKVTETEVAAAAVA